jgi:DNA-binding MarR family transcriptional regulator
VTSLEQLYRRPGFLLRRAHQLSVGLFERHCASLKLTPPQFGILHMLAHASDLDQAALARALGFDKVTTLHIVRGLESRGLVTRNDCPEDKRRRTINLTAEGKAVLDSAQRSAALASKELLSPLLADERKQLLYLLEKLCGGLEDKARTPVVPPMSPF